MAHDKDRKPDQGPVRKPVDTGASPDPRFDDSLDDRRGNRRGLFQRLGHRFQEQIETSRGGAEFDGHEDLSGQSVPASRPVSGPAPQRTPIPQTQPQPRADDPAARRPKEAPKVVRMLIPEGVVITGSVTSTSDAEISGKIEGDVTVEGVLYLGSTALISGSVKAASCRVEGLVAGKVECGQELEIGESGRLNADAVAGKRVTLAGEVTGNISTGGLLRLLPSAKIAGDIRARAFVIEEGASFNGKCSMRPAGEKQPPAQQAQQNPKEQQPLKEVKD